LNHNNSHVEVNQQNQSDTDSHVSSENQKIDDLKKYSIAMKNVILPFPVENDLEIPHWLTSTQTLMDDFQVPNELRVSIISPFLAGKARTCYNLMTPEIKNHFDSFRQCLLNEYKVTAGKCKQIFMNLKREGEESFTQFKTKLELSYRNYLESRQVKEFQDLVDLIIADRLKELLPEDLKRYLLTLEIGDKWLHPAELVDLLDKYSNNRAVSFSSNENKRNNFRHHNHNNNWNVNRVNMSTA